MHFLIAVSGFSGSGKDEFCKPLVEKFKATQIGLADPAKRHMADVYGFTEEQLFGPSSARNKGDLRYPKEFTVNIGMVEWKTPLPTELVDTLDLNKKYWIYEGYNIDAPYNKRHPNLDCGVDDKGHLRQYFVEEGDPDYWLSPREALQIYMMKMQELYDDTWIRKAIEDHLKFASDRFLYTYTKMGGLKYFDKASDYISRPDVLTCCADIRHWNEIKALRTINQENCTPILVRIKSKRVPKPPFDHKSETEQATIPDSEFNYIIENDGTVEDLHRKARILASNLINPDLKFSKIGNPYKTNTL